MSAVDDPQALELFAAHPVDLVLLDYVMPGMNGKAVAEEMKARKPRVPVIMVSANSAPDETLPYLDSFVVKGKRPAFLLKPSSNYSCPFRPRILLTGQHRQVNRRISNRTHLT